MIAPGTLLLTRSQISKLLGAEECVRVVEEAFRLHGEGRIAPPSLLGMHTRDGGFHVKAALFDKGSESFFVAKCNANFAQNPKRHRLPTIQGVLLLADAVCGIPLVVMDSGEITVRRTAAATAVAAKYLSREDSKTMTICGCGNQGAAHLETIRNVRNIQGVYVYDIDHEKAMLLAEEYSQRVSVTAVTLEELSSALRKSDICITCTSSDHYFVRCSDISPGTFIAAVGADNEHKQEIDPRLFISNKIVADVTEQSATIGDTHHALDLGLITRSHIHGELGAIVAGRRAGRTTKEEVIIFDSTGVAFQDAAVAVLVYNRALAQDIGRRLDFND
ncbi:MAG TPA: ornithine cyclodeaminase family protein [Bacteroidota bacterium]|nr:ornithine cyclodeaminase family protein [Bacteroidota bacterium]